LRSGRSSLKTVHWTVLFAFAKAKAKHASPYAMSVFGLLRFASLM